LPQLDDEPILRGPAVEHETVEQRARYVDVVSGLVADVTQQGAQRAAAGLDEVQLVAVGVGEIGRVAAGRHGQAQRHVGVFEQAAAVAWKWLQLERARRARVVTAQ
jgi:hypothetical protein